MRRVLPGEGVPIGVRGLATGFLIDTVPELGWAELTNGDQIAAAEEAGFDVMITTNQNIRHQQNLTNRRLALVVLTTNHWDTIRAHADGILPAIEAAGPGSYATVTFPRRPRRRRIHKLWLMAPGL